jgi:colanic acid/amylovoran biosynthesis glycosyltransferase
MRVIKALHLVGANFWKSPVTMIDSVNLFKHGRDAASLRRLFRIVPFVENEEASVVLCHFGPNGNLGLRQREAGLIKGKIVTVFHGYDLSAYMVRESDRVYQELFEKGDLFLPISEYWKTRLIELGCSEDKIIVHRMGVDCKSLRFAPPVYDKASRIRILTVGRLVEKKGVEYGIRAISGLIKKYGNLVEYSIVGSGPLLDRLAALISELGAEEDIRLLGAEDSAAVHERLGRAHLFLLPSVTDANGDKEGIPVVLMEAMAAGLPVVSTWHSGIPELVKDGESGFLVPERDVEALEERLAHLIEHPEVWGRLGHAGREFVERHFDVNQLNDRLVRIFQELLGAT